MRVVIFEEAADTAPRGARFRGAGAFARHCALPCVPWPRTFEEVALLVAHDRGLAERAARAGVEVILLAGAETQVPGLVAGVCVVRSHSAFVADLLLADLLAAAAKLAPLAIAQLPSCGIVLEGMRCAEIAHGGTRARPDSVGVDLFKHHAQDWLGDPRDLWCFARESFDSVLLHQVFEHPADRAAAHAEALRITRPGGTLLVIDRSRPGARVERIVKPATTHHEVGQPEPEVSVLLIAERSGDPSADACSLVATVRAARASLGEVPHEVLLLIRDPLPGADKAAVEELTHDSRVRVRHDTRPWSWPRRAELLRSAARGRALLVLAPGVVPTERSLAELHTAARTSGAGVAIPEPAHGARGNAFHQTLTSCVWIDAAAWPPGLGDRTAYLTPLFLTTLGESRRVANAGIAVPGLCGKPLAATRLAPWRFDAALPRAALPVRRILVCCLRSLGDCVLATAPIAGLRDRYPDAEISVLTEAAYAPLFVHDPAVDVVLAAPRGAAEELFWHEDMVLCAGIARHGPFDKLAFLSDRQDNLSYVNAGIAMHAFYCVQAGVPEASAFAPTLALPDSTRAAARIRLAAHQITGRYAVLHTNAGWAEKNPSEQLFAAIVDEITERCGLPVVIVGGPGEFTHPRATSLAGLQDLLESLGVIAGAAFYVGPDSGSLHAASALGVPSLGLFAGTAMRVSPLYASTKIAVQSPASCRLPCGTSPCRERQPCAPALRIEHLRPHLHALARGESVRPEHSEWIGNRPARWIQSPAGATWVGDESLASEPLDAPELPHRVVTARRDPLQITFLACDLEPAALVAHQRAYLELRDNLIPEPRTVRYPSGSKETNPWPRPSARSATS